MTISETKHFKEIQALGSKYYVALEKKNLALIEEIETDLLSIKSKLPQYKTAFPSRIRSIFDVVECIKQFRQLSKAEQQMFVEFFERTDQPNIVWYDSRSK